MTKTAAARRHRFRLDAYKPDAIAHALAESSNPPRFPGALHLPFHAHADHFDQALVHIDRARETNPQAHFGREMYFDGMDLSPPNPIDAIGRGAGWFGVAAGGTTGLIVRLWGLMVVRRGRVESSIRTEVSRVVLSRPG